MLSNSLALPEQFNFPVGLEPIYHNGIKIPKKDGQFVVNKRTNEPISIVGGQYVAHDYNHFWEPFIKGIYMSGLDLSNATVKFISIQNCSAMKAIITIPNDVISNIVGEPMALGIDFKTSHNGSLKYEVTVYNIRLACENGLLRIAESTSAKFKHTIGTDPERIATVASTWPSELRKDAHLFNHMREVPISLPVAEAFLAKNLCITQTKHGRIKINKKWLNNMLSFHDFYKSTMGDTAWTLYNALTHYGTHVDTDSIRGDVGQRAIRQEKDVQTLVRGSAWKSLIRFGDFEQQQLVVA